MLQAEGASASPDCGLGTLRRLSHLCFGAILQLEKVILLITFGSSCLLIPRPGRQAMQVPGLGKPHVERQGVQVSCSLRSAHSGCSHFIAGFDGQQSLNSQFPLSDSFV